MTKKEIQNILTKEMNNACHRANNYSSCEFNGVSEYSYYRGLADGYLKAKEIVDNIEIDKFLIYLAGALAEGVLCNWDYDGLKKQAKELTDICKPYLYGQDNNTCK